MPLVSISDVIDVTNDGTRCLIEGERLIDAKMLVTVGSLGLSDDKVLRVWALCLQSSTLAGTPHVVEASLNLRTFSKRVTKISCSCKAGKSEKCKHCIGLLMFLNRIDNESELKDLSCTDLAQQWGKLKKAALSEFEALPLTDFCHFTPPVPIYTSGVPEVSDAFASDFAKLIIQGAPKSELFLHSSGARAAASRRNCKPDILAAEVLAKRQAAGKLTEVLPGMETSLCFKKLKNLTDAKVKIQILTLVPHCWSIGKTMTEMNASRWIVRIARKLVAENGILSKRNPKTGKVLSHAIETQIQEFYEDDENSRLMPGMKDVVSVKSASGERVHTQKRLILSNLTELFRMFQMQYPDIKVGFTSFARLRPQHCVLAGQSGTHTVCVCTYHKNIKLMLDACKINKLTANFPTPLTNYEDCLRSIICENPSSKCYTLKCTQCPKDEAFLSQLRECFENEMIDSVTFCRWVSVDRTTLETCIKPTEEFLICLYEGLKILLPHSFIAKQQSCFKKKVKTNLGDAEFLIELDFAQNYAFIVQNAAQGFHWNNDQATLHPFVIYYKNNGKLEHQSLVVISECLEHNTSAVYTFQKILVEFIENKLNSRPKKFFYFSDGAPQQYKNRKMFSNLYHHKEDFGIDGEWHFHATAHGKGPCDGLAGNVKRLASRASLQLPPSQQIITPEKLYQWAKDNIPGVNFVFSNQRDYDETMDFLQHRYTTAGTVKGTLKFHAAIPMANSNKILFKSYSLSETGALIKIKN